MSQFPARGALTMRQSRGKGEVGGVFSWSLANDTKSETGFAYLY